MAFESGDLGAVLRCRSILNDANAVVVPLSALGQLDLEINAGNFATPGTAVAHARAVILGYPTDIGYSK
jgi:hypothetical protein